MALDDVAILVVCDDGHMATRLVSRIETAHGDIVYAANTYEALERLKRYSFDAAVLVWYDGAAQVAAAVMAKSLPLCILADEAVTVPSNISSLTIGDADQLIPALNVLLKRDAR
jgi:hypothetical protein